MAEAAARARLFRVSRVLEPTLVVAAAAEGVAGFRLALPGPYLSVITRDGRLLPCLLVMLLVLSLALLFWMLAPLLGAGLAILASSF